GNGKKLVIIQLSGGNDGLNTIVPHQNDLYYSLRPSLHLKEKELIKMNDELGFNAALESLRSLYDDGLMSIVNSVGYPNPDRSHFRSMDIWHTASDSSEYLSTGWLGRYLDNQCSGCEKPHHAIELDNSLSLALKGNQRNGFAMTRPDQLKRTTQNRFLKAVADTHEAGQNAQVDFLYKTMTDTQSSANYLYEQSRVHRSGGSYPAGEFGRDLKQVAELLTADTDTQIYYVSLTGFDTHANQKGRHARLLKNYAEGVKAFVADLRQNKLLDDTLIMTFSEFGRRVKQNASQGTDHGTANNLFLFGGSLKQQGFVNKAPQLTQLDKGDLRFEVDFRSIYTNLLEDWLEVDATKILGKRFEKLRLV
ncbi:MAG: DUF1501 domain-containing protein, partial [Bacteroidota bacterium]